ncbi:MAG TPA: tyrosine-type recombinase/integrase [Ktedonobacteraceae bacterium]|nr:tyrosine-type recombinase/integrase [Ktedonobacteraceae bacterium]
MAKKANGEGSIYRRKVDGMYVGSITLEDGKRKYFYSKKRQEVYDKMQKALQEKKQGTLVTAPQQSLAQYLTYWLENSVQDTLRPRSYERYEGIVRLHLIPVLGKVKLQSLTPQHVQLLKSQKVKEGLSAKTVGLIHVVLHRALDDAIKLGLVARNVCDVVSPPREEKKEIHPLTLEQIHRLLHTAKGHALETLVTLALATGMRRGELLGLKWQDIDFGKGILRVRRILSRVPTLVRTDGDETYVETEPKTKGSRRSIALTGFAIDALKKHRRHQEEARRVAGTSWEDHDYVFYTPTGRHLSPSSSVLDPFKILLKRAGLPDIRFHDLRHSAATLLLGEGVNPKVVQEILGHSKISMTMDIYSHVMPIMQSDAMDKLHHAFTDSIEEEENDDGDESGGVLARK